MNRAASVGVLFLATLGVSCAFDGGGGDAPPTAVAVYAPNDLQTAVAVQPLVGSPLIVHRPDYSSLSEDEISSALRAATTVVEWPSRVVVPGTFEVGMDPDLPGSGGSYAFLRFTPSDPAPATGWFAVIIDHDALPSGFDHVVGGHEQVVRYSRESRPIITWVRTQPVVLGPYGDPPGYPPWDVSKDLLALGFSEPLFGELTVLLGAISVTSGAGGSIDCVPYFAPSSPNPGIVFAEFQCSRFHDGDRIRIHIDGTVAPAGGAPPAWGYAAAVGGGIDLDLTLHETGEPGNTNGDDASLLAAAGVASVMP